MVGGVLNTLVQFQPVCILVYLRVALLKGFVSVVARLEPSQIASCSVAALLGAGGDDSGTNTTFGQEGICGASNTCAVCLGLVLRCQQIVSEVLEDKSCTFTFLRQSNLLPMKQTYAVCKSSPFRALINHMRLGNQSAHLQRLTEIALRCSSSKS